MDEKECSYTMLLAENQRLKEKVSELSQIVSAISSGEVDAFVVSTQDGRKIYSVEGAEGVYRSFIENITECALTLDPNGCILSANRQFASLTGVPHESLPGTPFLSFVREGGDIWKSAFDERGHDSMQGEIDVRSRDGAVTPVSFLLTSVTDSHIEIPILLLTDITERKKTEGQLAVYREHLEDLVKERTFDLEMEISERIKVQCSLLESESRLRMMFEGHNAVMLLIYPENGAIIDANPAATEFYGYSREQLCSMKISDINVLDHDQILERCQIAKFKKINHFIFEHRLSCGEIRTVEVYSSPIEVKGERILFSIIHDITERRLVEKRLEEIRASLEEQVKERTKELKEINEDLLKEISAHKRSEDALKVVNRQLNLMTGITRHDIVNQVYILELLVDLIGSRIDLSMVSREYEGVCSAIERIRDQIEFTRIYQDMGVHEPVWHDLFLLLNKEITPPGVDFRVMVDDMEIFADPLIERVFFNLLDNSVRHGINLTEISVTSKTTPGGLILTWADNGGGIPIHQKEAIFERGYGKNTGLGLFFIREILSITGISIIENGIDGVGARFEMNIPSEGWRRRQQNNPDETVL